MTHDAPTPRRDAALRAELVALAHEPARRRAVRPGATALAAVLAFGLAGAGAGAAVAATAGAAGSGAPVEVEIAEVAMMDVGSATELFGTPVIVTGSGETLVDLGARPDGATALAMRLSCLDDGRFDVEIDGEPQGWLGCDGDAVQAESSESEIVLGGGFFQHVEIEGDGPHALSISSTEGARYALWVAWSDPPVAPAPSAIQQEALSDDTVTREEYLAGLDRYQACIEEAGWTVVIVDRDAPVVDYRLDAGAVGDGSDLQCYAAEFEQLDTAWQLSLEG